MSLMTVWTREVLRSELKGNVYAFGPNHLNIAPADIKTFVTPRDAAIMLCCSDHSFVAWWATMRRRDGGRDAIVETIKPIMVALADEDSLATLVLALVERAREIGYARVWLTPELFAEPLLAPALKHVTSALGRPLEHAPLEGMTALVLEAEGAPPRRAWWRFWRS